MNSVVQVLNDLPAFKKAYNEPALSHLLQCPKFAPECHECQIYKLFWALNDGRYAVEKEERKIIFEGMSEEEKNKKEFCQEGVTPYMFKHVIARNHQDFKTNQQQDAQEYFHFFLEELLKVQKRNKLGNPGEIFDFELETKVQCNECKCVRLTKAKQN